jgi:DNA-binding transcriptional ArsR family regulator
MLEFAALADPTRRQIVEILAGGERSAGEIAARFKTVSQPAISQHLKVLREARLVQVRAAAQRRIYALDPTGLAEIDQWLAKTRQFWSRRLDELERQLIHKTNHPSRGKRHERSWRNFEWEYGSV